MRLFRSFSLLTLAAALAVLGFAASLQPVASGQATGSTGGITGIVVDQQGATVPNAKISISNKETGFSTTLSSGSSGLFNLGSVAPGTYTVRVEAPNFKTTQTTAVVSVGQVTTVNTTLEV